MVLEIVCLKKLKTILQCNYFFYIFLIFSLLFTFVYINNDYKSYYNEEYKEVIGIVKDYKIKDNKTIIYIKSKENLVINYYKKIDNISYGDYIKVKGEFYKPKNNTNFNLFNYKKYLLSKKIKYAVTGNDIAIIRKNKNILYALKNKLLDRVNKCNKTSNYIKTFLFADKNYIQEEIYKSYQTLGVSHLFAISGMHVSLVTMLLLKILYKLKEKNKYLIISIFLLFYLFLTNFTVSMLRAVFQFILFFINKLFKLNIKNTNLVILLFSLFLIINPYNIYNIGFMFSFSISFSLIRFNNLLSNGNFLYKLFKVSIISFLTSIPILINNFNNINLLSVVFNIIYVPYISYIVFPFSLITIIFPFLDNLTFVFINIFENISIFLSNINILTISISKLPTYLIIIYYIFLYILFNNIKLKNIIFMIIIFIIFVLYRKYLFNSEIVFMNVNQVVTQKSICILKKAKERQGDYNG